MPDANQLARLPAALTSVPVALDMLLHKRITVVDYARCPDVNDRVGMQEY